MKEKMSSSRVKDLLILCAFSLAALGISYFMSDMFSSRGEKPLIYLWYILLAFTAVVSYFESRDNDPFVTGKTQTMGVMNSFVGAGALMVILAVNVRSWALYSVVIIAVMLLAREAGYRSRIRFQELYLGKSGTMQSDLHNKGKASIDGKNVTVWSKDHISSGTVIQVTEIIGRYRYVSPMQK